MTAKIKQRTPLTPAQKATLTRKRRAAGRKATDTKRRNATALTKQKPPAELPAPKLKIPSFALDMRIFSSMGHKHITMTLRYAHLAPGHKRSAIEVSDQYAEKVPAIFITSHRRPECHVLQVIEK
jgi:hypothetical protein